jgi:Domain of unknown function (DUF6468)
MMLSLFGDAIVAVLLVATISYAAVLNRRLAVLRGDRARFEELIQGLTAAAQRAEAGIAGLKAVAEDSGRRLEKKLEEAHSLRDDLSYMLERGGGVADRLEGKIRARREETKPEPQPRKRDGKLDPSQRAAAPDETSAAAAATSRAERELLRALAGR